MNQKKQLFKLIFALTFVLQAEQHVVHVQPGASMFVINIHSGEKGPMVIQTSASNAPTDNSKIENKSTSDLKSDQENTQAVQLDTKQLTEQQNVQDAHLDTKQLTDQKTAQDIVQKVDQDTTQKNLQESDQLTAQQSHQLNKNTTDQKSENSTSVPVSQIQTNNPPAPKDSTDTASWWQQMRLTPILGTMVGLAGTGLIIRALIIHQTVTILKNKRSWSNWKHEVPVEQLKQMPQERISQELITTIQTYHRNPHNPADHVYPMTHFLHTINQEIEALKRYLVLQKVERILHTDRLLKRKDLTDLVERRLEKLSHLKTVFFSWAKEHRTKRMVIAKKD